jgi:hypothetical protein
MASFNARRPTSQIIYSGTWHIKFRVEKVCGIDECKIKNETIYVCFHYGQIYHIYVDL